MHDSSVVIKIVFSKTSAGPVCRQWIADLDNEGTLMHSGMQVIISATWAYIPSNFIDCSSAERRHPYILVCCRLRPQLLNSASENDCPLFIFCVIENTARRSIPNFFNKCQNFRLWG